MSSKEICPKGFRIYTGNEASLMWGLVRDVSMDLENMGATPIFLPAICCREVFESGNHGLLKDSMFETKWGYLKPEATWMIAAYYSRSSALDSLKKGVYYFDQMFRYERPQSGRRRSFYQLGYEIAFNKGDKRQIPDSIKSIKTVLDRISQRFNIKCIVRVNYLGLPISWTRKITEKSVSMNITVGDLRRKLDDGLCRIHLDWSSLDRNEMSDLIQIHRWFKVYKINWVFDETLYRGLHYYSRMVFEVEMKGTSMSILSGGFYDGIMSKMDSRRYGAISNFGWAVGISRLVELIDTHDGK